MRLPQPDAEDVSDGTAVAESVGEADAQKEPAADAETDGVPQFDADTVAPADKLRGALKLPVPLALSDALPDGDAVRAQLALRSALPVRATVFVPSVLAELAPVCVVLGELRADALLQPLALPGADGERVADAHAVEDPVALGACEGEVDAETVGEIVPAAVGGALGDAAAEPDPEREPLLLADAQALVVGDAVGRTLMLALPLAEAVVVKPDSVGDVEPDPHALAALLRDAVADIILEGETAGDGDVVTRPLRDPDGEPLALPQPVCDALPLVAAEPVGAPPLAEALVEPHVVKDAVAQALLEPKLE